MGRVMAAHQPNFLPYLGFFDKMMSSDIFVIRDEVQFVERDFHHRNRIKIEGTDGTGAPRSKWLTVPVYKAEAPIRDIRIQADLRQKHQFWHQVMTNQLKGSYEGTPHFETFFPAVADALSHASPLLIDLNLTIIGLLREAFGIRTEIALASELPGYRRAGTASGDLAALCAATGATEYLSGSGGKDYLNLESFERAGVRVRFQDFHHPVYPQRYDGFLPNLSAIDALFNVGAFPKPA